MNFDCKDVHFAHTLPKLSYFFLLQDCKNRPDVLDVEKDKRCTLLKTNDFIFLVQNQAAPVELVVDLQCH